MNEPKPGSRLSRIVTRWSMLRRIHGADASSRRAALSDFVERYRGAVWRYLRAAVSSDEEADELFQRFALKLVEGKLGGADPQRGSFRKYLKSVLFHLVKDRYREPSPPTLESAGEAAHDLPGLEMASAQDEAFRQSLRNDILSRAWLRLQQLEASRGIPFFQMLKARSELPELSISALAERRLAHLPRVPRDEAALRKLLQRARSWFARFVVDEVAHWAGDPPASELEQELADLQLLCYCRDALADRSGGGVR